MHTLRQFILCLSGQYVTFIPIQKNGTYGGSQESTDYVVISEQETKMDGVQHVSNGRDQG